MKLVTALAAAAAISASILAIPAAAQDQAPEWQTHKKDGRCWASVTPVSSASGATRSAALLSIQNFPSEGVRGSVAVVSGLSADEAGDAELKVNGQSFDVLPYGGAAFVASGKPEAALIAAMKKGRELSVTWTNAQGTEESDTYSLIGFTAAKNEIDRMCR